MAVTVAEPSEPPLQLTSVEVAVALNAPGAVIVAVAVEGHPLASVIVAV